MIWFSLIEHQYLIDKMSKNISTIDCTATLKQTDQNLFKYKNIYFYITKLCH